MKPMPKEHPIRDRRYLDSLRDERCLFTGLWTSSAETVDPAHVGKRGLGYKESDDCAIPLIHHLQRSRT